MNSLMNMMLIGWLFVGNSFRPDFVNVILESRIADDV